MKFKLLKAAFAGAVLTVSGLANAGLISTSDWEVTGQSGNWDLATTSYHVSTADPSTSYIDELMSNGYIAYAQSNLSPINGIDAYPSTTSLTISFNDIFEFDNVEVWFTRYLSSSSIISINYGIDSVSSLFSANSLSSYGFNSTGYNLLDLKVLDLVTSGSFQANKIQLTFNNPQQIIMHELQFSGTLVQQDQTQDVPEPSTLAIFALGMIGLASRRFKKQS
jgi:hypothetical protein